MKAIVNNKNEVCDKMVENIVQNNSSCRWKNKARVWPVNPGFDAHFDPQEKSPVRRFDPLRISGTASKFNTTYQKSIHVTWKIDMCYLG